MKELLFIALVLACPPTMILMMRGHGHGGHAGQIGSRHGDGDISSELKSTAEHRGAAAVTDDAGHDGPSR
jgi:hypothetical protein